METEALIRVTAPHFVAGVVIRETQGIKYVHDAAPIMYYMVKQGWIWSKFVNYMLRKNWQWEQIR